jgi:tetratricopeptide (TPR) repeat protein
MAMCGMRRRPWEIHWLYVQFLLAASYFLPGVAALQAADTPPITSLDAPLADLPLEPSTRQQIAAAIKSHDYADAEAALVLAASQHPKEPLIYDYLGRLFFLDAKYLNAAIALKKGEALQPLNEKDRFTLAMAYVEIERPDWARPELEKLAQANPRNPLYPYWQGRLDYNDQNLPQAAAKFEEAIALDSQFMKAYDNLGLCLEGMAKYDEAIQQYRHAIQLNREHHIGSAWPSLNLGTLLVKLDRLEEAEPLLRESLQLSGAFALAHYQLGSLLQRQNKITEALEELNRAAALDPADPQPHYALARIYKRAGNQEQAQRELQIFQNLKTKAPVQKLE